MRRNRDLDPITPDAALEYYLDARRYDLRETTLRTHRARLKSFTDWLKDQNVENINDVDLQLVHAYRVYKREDNGDDSPCNDVTMQGQVSTVRRFLAHLVDIDAVREELPERVRLPKVHGDDSRDTMLGQGRAKAILEYLQDFQYASSEHVTLLLMWRTSARRGGVRSLDLKDFDRDDRALCFRHRPKKGTPLKNGERGERDVSLAPHVAHVLEDYIESPNRYDTTDEYNRSPLITTKYGRPSVGTYQNWIYRFTRPCVIGEPCPHDYDPSTCNYTAHDRASGCPSSVSPHAVRKGSITALRDSGTPREVVSDRGDVSEKILEKHYDKASKRQRMRRRKDHLPEDF
ncbi:phage integrase/site-specific recombinase [Halogeometricum pallidum JCM 14848]|uniref:Phage integrase/site-specific recombinase n=1 Tax=Halogeometricum pallidum JCM 14848 TaxID=1227487 RepID=M0DFA2_HALPD|nr:site-specific integrase [Halogeometricum pallidum]ELZ33407.1 phage integrase/site-specific recombinase [Halogeometricum pallidum JCM 14848]